ncbi:hypothetical protein KP79_PYT12367 [Mizuhopecten yessoensis]|uniref:Uncharacterized protein n=1 Tax=Mizuhopecten yessoensis TaxID=6573 RepID=A0A210PZH5_MIZYE|nr:hypothetical protein KP79_PYT12367 [Mizuhopecten yessoensis]
MASMQRVGTTTTTVTQVASQPSPSTTPILQQAIPGKPASGPPQGALEAAQLAKEAAQRQAEMSMGKPVMTTTATPMPPPMPSTMSQSIPAQKAVTNQQLMQQVRSPTSASLPQTVRSPQPTLSPRQQLNPSPRQPQMSPHHVVSSSPHPGAMGGDPNQMNTDPSLLLSGGMSLQNQPPDGGLSLPQDTEVTPQDQLSRYVETL